MVGAVPTELLKGTILMTYEESRNIYSCAFWKKARSYVTIVGKRVGETGRVEYEIASSSHGQHHYIGWIDYSLLDHTAPSYWKEKEWNTQPVDIRIIPWIERKRNNNG